MEGKVFAVKTAGGSMRPAIKTGEFAIIEKAGLAARKRFRPGDAVLYQAGGKKYIHRIREIRGSTAIITDDTGVISEQEIALEDITGRIPGLLNGYPGLIYNRLSRGIRTLLRK